MNSNRKSDWDPMSPEVLRNQRTAYDKMRETCPVAYSDLMKWSIFRHEDVSYVLQHPEIFSSAVSSHLSVPSGMDPPEHTAYRKIVEEYFTPRYVKPFESTCQQIAANLVQHFASRGGGEIMADLALPFSVEVQCAFLGWPEDFRKPLIQWLHKSHEATRIQNSSALSELARRFEGFINDIVEHRLQGKADPQFDLMASLLQQRVWNRQLSHAEITSILRNWTAGEVGTIASAIGILTHFLAESPQLQSQLRSEPSRIAPAIEEILRIDGPLVANRRVAKRDIELSGRTITAGEHLSLVWISANRDGRVFQAPETFHWDRDPNLNLLWGAGIHMCPGAPLARLEMRILLEEILCNSIHISLLPDKPAKRAVYPTSGFSELWLTIQ